MPPASPSWLAFADNGRPALVLEGDEASSVAWILTQANAVARRAGHAQPFDTELVARVASFARIAAWGSSANGTDARHRASGGTPSVFVRTTDIAAREGIDPRAVRKRCERGHYPGARRFGRQWAIPITALDGGAD